MLCLSSGSGLVALKTLIFTIAWHHSVEKTLWTETYRIDKDQLTLIEASVEGTGAGMEIPENAVFKGGRWVWHPNTSLESLRLTRSEFTEDYNFCEQDKCQPMADVIRAQKDVTEIYSCTL